MWYQVILGWALLELFVQEGFLRRCFDVFEITFQFDEKDPIMPGAKKEKEKKKKTLYEA